MVFNHYSAPKLLFDLIQERLALTLNNQRRAEIMRSMDELMAAEGFSCIEDFVSRLNELPTTQSLWQRLIHLSTIGETYFFRDRSQLNALQHVVLPGLIAERRLQNSKQLRIWSAGCATGEEPYTLAIMLREMLPDFEDWNIFILGTDLNIGSLERAREGKYRPWSFRSETPPQTRQKWFVEAQGNYLIDHSIREMVTFEPLNLGSGDYFSYSKSTFDMDLILCRNVLIYFDNPTIATVIKGFENALRPHGWLVLGHSESAHSASGNYRPRNFENAVLFQKGSPTNNMVSPSVAPSGDVFNRELAVPPVSILKLPTNPASNPIGKPEVSEEVTADSPWRQALNATNKENWSEALKWLTVAEQKNKFCPEVHYLRGVVALHQGNLKDAQASLRQAIYCDHTFVLAHFLLGEIFEQQQHFKRAFSYWKQAHALLEYLPIDQALAYSEDLTVEIMQAVLKYRLDKLPT